MSNSHLENDAHPIHSFLSQLHQYLSRTLRFITINQSATFAMVELYKILEWCLKQYEFKLPRMTQFKHKMIKVRYCWTFDKSMFFPEGFFDSVSKV